MKRSTWLALVASAVCLLPSLGRAADSSGKPSAAEMAFVTKVSADLNERFATPEAAVKAGYIRYTDEDESGAISYANREWTSRDAAHPSQLWYDTKGRLLGADFSVPKTSKPPTLFGLQPARWQPLPAHVHYGLAGPGGTLYGGAGAKTMTKGGASVGHPTAQALVAAGITKKAGDVLFTFTFPAIWDVALWVIPNPDGAFAEKNPDVKPVNPPKGKM